MGINNNIKTISNKNYNIPFNYELNKKIAESLIKNTEENSKMNNLIQKNIQKEIKKCKFRQNFKEKNIKYRYIMSLINLIYLNAANKILKEKSNLNIYEQLFNINISKDNIKIFEGKVNNCINCNNNNKLDKIIYNKKIIKSFEIGRKKNNLNKINNQINKIEKKSVIYLK